MTRPSVITGVSGHRISTFPERGLIFVVSDEDLNAVLTFEVPQPI